MTSVKVYSLRIRPYYNNENYTHIIQIDKEPLGPLKNFVKRLNIQNISPFHTFSNTFCENTSCLYALYDIENPNNLMCLSKINDLYAFILQNSDVYTIDDKLANMMYKSNITNEQNRLLFNIIYREST
jgi:hypothetical protein